MRQIRAHDSTCCERQSRRCTNAAGAPGNGCNTISKAHVREDNCERKSIELSFSRFCSTNLHRRHVDGTNLHHNSQEICFGPDFGNQLAFDTISV